MTTGRGRRWGRHALDQSCIGAEEVVLRRGMKTASLPELSVERDLTASVAYRHARYALFWLRLLSKSEIRCLANRKPANFMGAIYKKRWQLIDELTEPSNVFERSNAPQRQSSTRVGGRCRQGVGRGGEPRRCFSSYSTLLFCSVRIDFTFLVFMADPLKKRHQWG